MNKISKKYEEVELGKYIIEVSDRNKENLPLTVLSVTKSLGFVNSKEFFSKEVYSKKLTNYKIVHKGNLAYNPSRINVGSISLLENIDSGLVSPLYVVFKPTEEFNPKFILLYLKSKRGLNYIRNLTSGSVRDSLSFKALSKIKIPKISLEEQQKAISVLEKVEFIKQKREEADNLIRNYLVSIFSQMFGDPIKNNKKWPLYKLMDFGIWQSGGTPSRADSTYFIGNINWYSSGELNEMFIFDSRENISESAIKESSAKLILKNSLLLGMYDTAALKSSITTRTCSCNQAIAFSKLEKNNVNIIYLYFAIQIGRKFFMRGQRGVRQKNLNLMMIKNIEVPLPPLDLQQKFAVIVDNFEKLKEKQILSKKQINIMYDSLVKQVYCGN